MSSYVELSHFTVFILCSLGTGTGVSAVPASYFSGSRDSHWLGAALSNCGCCQVVFSNVGFVPAFPGPRRKFLCHWTGIGNWCFIIICISVWVYTFCSNIHPWLLEVRFLYYWSVISKQAFPLELASTF